MDAAAVETHLTVMLGHVVAALDMVTDLPYILAESVTYDLDGLWPGTAGYVYTYDGDWAAAVAADLLAARAMAAGTTVRFSSEGAMFERAPADLAGLAHRLRARSTLARAAGHPGIIEVDGRLSGYQPTTPAALAGVESNWP